MDETKLIILRGPSGSGKSTVAKRLQLEARKPLAVIEQDYYKLSLFSYAAAGNLSELRREMLVDDALYILSRGYDVVVEGIMSRGKYSQALLDLVKRHNGSSFVYYFDIPFDETVKRHSMRHKSAEFGADKMKEWFLEADHLGAKEEAVIIPEMTEEEVVDLIKKQADI
ncbi:MAG TPA: AAA family ATPase [Candidatus Saccharimonadales bacterium]|nr:AAA family ATPase [Candidatus Saccharimonadales bacterium]